MYPVLTSVKFDIDEELWYGVSSDEQAEAQAAKSMAARMGRIVGAKPFPVAAQRLAETTRDPNCLMDEVVTILETDPALSARLLRLVNSVGFSLRTPCTSVRHAAALVGTEKLNQVASTAAILDMYESSSERAAQLLEHATVVGALCRYLAFHFGLPPDELFTCGFLHDIGKLMLLDTEGEEYLALLDADAGQFDTTFIEERKRFGFDHALLAGHVLAAWNIPHPVPKVVAWHHHVTRAYAESTQISQMVSTLRLADAMAYALRQPDTEAQIQDLARMEAASYMDISEGQIAAMWEEVRALTERARAVFRGEKVPDNELAHTSRPSGASMRAVARAKLQDRTPSRSPAAPVLSERPRHFPCVVCDAPSYAYKCSACHGYMCPMHVAGEDEWCELCQRSYEEAGIPEIRPVVSTLFGALLGVLLAAAFFGAASAGAQRPMRLMIGPTLILMLLGMLVGIAQRWVRRWWFLRTRPNRASIMPAAVEAVLDIAMQQSPMIVEVTSASEPSPPTERLSTPESFEASFEVPADPDLEVSAAGPATSSMDGATERPSGPSAQQATSMAQAPFAEPTASNLRYPEFPGPPGVPVVETPDGSGAGRGSVPPRERHWMSSSRPSTPVPSAATSEAPGEPAPSEPEPLPIADERAAVVPPSPSLAPAARARPSGRAAAAARSGAPPEAKAPSRAASGRPATVSAAPTTVSAAPATVSAAPANQARRAASARPPTASAAPSPDARARATSGRPASASLVPAASRAAPASGANPSAGSRPSVSGGRRSGAPAARAATSARPGARDPAPSRRPSSAPRAAPAALAQDSRERAVQVPASAPPAAARQTNGPAALATDETQLDVLAVASASRSAQAAVAVAVAESPPAPAPEVPESAVQAVTNAEKLPSEPPRSGWSSVLDAQGTASGW